MTRISSDKFVSALVNTFQYDLKVNAEKNNAFFMFSPHRFKPILFDIFVQFFVSFSVILLFPLVPLFRRLRAVNIDVNNNKQLLVVSSEKSINLYKSIGFSPSNFDIVSTSGYGADYLFSRWSLTDYYTYICACSSFIKFYRFNFWFYPAILNIPKMITFSSFLELNKPEKILFTNHYDRWTYLITDYCNSSGAESVLIQHGILDNSSRFSSVKYKKLSKLFCYNKEQYNDFLEFFYEKIEVCDYFKPVIVLSEIDNIAKTVLIVGHGDPSVVKVENEVTAWLVSNTDLFIYVKPHPVFKKNAVLYNSICEKVVLISERDFYPDVDFLLHSGSTLAEEYRNCSKKVTILSLSDFKKCATND